MNIEFFLLCDKQSRKNYGEEQYFPVEQIIVQKAFN